MFLGRPFDRQDRMSPDDWLSMFGPFDDSGEPIPLEDQPLTKALRANRPGYVEQQIRSLDGSYHDIAITGLPIVGADGFQGALVFFWPRAEAQS